MAEILEYNALITPEEVKADALQSLGFDPTSKQSVEGLSATYKDVTIRAIRAVTKQIEQYLDRTLIVDRYTIEIEDYRWAFNKPLNKWEHYTRHFPVVEVETANVSIGSENLRILSGVKKSTVDLFAGYKRADQDLAALQGNAAGEGNLPDLDTEPEVLPWDINRVAFRLVMYELDQAKKNLFAISTRTQEIAQNTVMITKEREDHYKSELSKLDPYKYLQF